ncbi:unnamed protein product, partial [Ranitomeya imitator]
MDLDKLETWAESWQMRFNIDKCKVIHMGRRNQYHHYTLNGKLLGKSDMEKDLGIPVNDKLTWSSQCQAAAAKANRIMGCIKKALALQEVEKGGEEWKISRREVRCTGHAKGAPSNQGKYRITKRGPALTNPMFTLVTKDWHEQLYPLIITLKDCVAEVVEKAKTSMTFVVLQELACGLPQCLRLTFRRDVVFSQALSGLICGFMIKLHSSLHNQGFLQQLHTVGLLVQYEGLLSTYSKYYKRARCEKASFYCVEAGPVTLLFKLLPNFNKFLLRGGGPSDVALQAPAEFQVSVVGESLMCFGREFQNMGEAREKSWMRLWEEWSREGGSKVACSFRKRAEKKAEIADRQCGILVSKEDLKSQEIQPLFNFRRVSLSAFSVASRVRLSVMIAPAELKTRSDNTLAAGHGSTFKAYKR